MTLHDKLKSLHEFMDNDDTGDELTLISHLTGILAELQNDNTIVTKEMLDLFDTSIKRKVLLTAFTSLLLQGISVNFGE
jgi:hypothetical protein